MSSHNLRADDISDANIPTKKTKTAAINKAPLKIIDGQKEAAGALKKTVNIIYLAANKKDNNNMLPAIKLKNQFALYSKK
jgi:hypothetical protein